MNFHCGWLITKEEKKKPPWTSILECPRFTNVEEKEWKKPLGTSFVESLYGWGVSEKKVQSYAWGMKSGKNSGVVAHIVD